MADATSIAAMSSAQASARLAEIQNDAGWTAKLLAGDGPAVKVFQALNQRIVGIDQDGNPLDTGTSVNIFDPDAAAKLSGYSATTESSGMTDREKVRDIAGLREQGYPELAIVEMYDEGRAYTAAEHQAAQRYINRWMQDREFQQKLFSGDFHAKYLVNCAARILSSNISEAA